MLEDYPVRRALMLYGLKILIVASDLQIPWQCDCRNYPTHLELAIAGTLRIPELNNYIVP